MAPTTKHFISVQELADYAAENMPTHGILKLIEALSRLVEGEDEPAEDDTGPANMRPRGEPPNMGVRGEDKRRRYTEDRFNLASDKSRDSVDFFDMYPEARNIKIG
jgi:hypothetical protein